MEINVIQDEFVLLYPGPEGMVCEKDIPQAGAAAYLHPARWKRMKSRHNLLSVIIIVLLILLIGLGTFPPGPAAALRLALVFSGC